MFCRGLALRSAAWQACLALALVLVAPLADAALKPSHEVDRLVLAAEEAIAAGDYGRAGAHLEQARGLGVGLPADYDFMYAKVLQQRNELENARSHLERYVDKVGRSGPHYREALSLITQIERRRSGASQRPTPDSGQRTAEIRWADDRGKYVQELQALYETGDRTEALTLHINNLLKFYAYGDERVIAARRMGTPSRHRIHLGERGEIVSMNRLGSSETEPFTEDRFPVYGIDPYLDYECSGATGNCWLMHPVSSEPWLQIVQNEQVAAELSRAFAQLIKELQKRG